MTLCKRCVDRLREKCIVRKVSEGELWSGQCDNCKTHTFVAKYEIEPKRRMDNE